MDGRSDRNWWRREYLAAAALTGVSGLAGCSGTDDTANGDDPTDADTDRKAGDDRSPTESTAEQYPPLAVRESSIGSDQLAIGTALTVTATVENVGDESGAFDVELALVDQREEIAVELDPGDRTDVSASAAPMTVGEGDISVNGERVGTVDVVPVASGDDRTVGAYYFSWYGRHPHTWQGGEWSLESPYTPTLGNYDARDDAVIEQHIDWCHYAGVQWLNAVWTGPYSPIDKNLKNHILPHPRADELEWSIFYDTLIISGIYDGSSVDLSEERVANELKENIAYLADEYFDRECYKTIDGRPVLTTWLGGAYTGDPAAVFAEAFDEAGVDPYFVVGIGGRPIDAVELTEIADAVTVYNPYTPRENIEEVFLDQLESTYRSWYLAGETTGHDVIPSVIPGFNDSELTHVDRDNPILELSTERYANACEVGDKYADGPVLVTAFNEWYESTFIEPSEEFGTSFLEITADTLAVEGWESPVSEGVMVTLSFETVVVASEISPGTDDDREVTLRVYELSVFNDGEKLREVDVGGPEEGVDFVRGYFGAETESDGRTARWLGGRPNSTLFFEGVDDIDRIEITGWAGVEMEVSVTVDEEPLGTTRLTEQYETYTIG
ncbi:CARDB domain-containing protein [Halolamina rubra]|uniref:CARDB domain-containing protein n=1 Tax=Halolamina rubra TaxID=1380430 RepID=UPI0006790516|nr:CARDB domain-containing protein [Halolamina rubra]